jgi:glyoxylase-like metal-dependent hydrolase (beta-lactamase superfamily II)/8-oxo-dGTP pyrophosphatase MutT (NUDIX family)
MTDQGLYEKVIATLGAGAEPPRPRSPRPSAAIVLWRRPADAELEVYWVRRSEKLRFMGGWHAFPGGGMSRRDAGLETLGEPRGVERAPADGALPPAVTEGFDLGPALRGGLVAAALRELFEETGILLAAGPDGERTAFEDLEQTRTRLLAREIGLREILAERRAVLDARALTWAGRWLTPPLGPMRFDNRFFLLEWPAELAQQPRVIPGELESGEWIAPAEALRRWREQRVMTAPPILHLLRVLAEDGPADGLERLWRPREANLGEYRLIEFRPGVLLFPLPTPTLPPATHTNTYVVGFDRCVLVDPGTPFEGELDRFAAALRAMPERIGRSVDAIWLTHHHPDHLGGAARLRRELGVPLLAHPRTAERLVAAGLEVDGALEDGEVHRLDGERPISLRILHTPGHARGHVCIFDEERRSLLAGDMVAGFGTIVVDPPEGDMDLYLESLERLRGLGDLILFPAHGPAIQNGRAKIEQYIAHRLRREELVLEAWNSGLRDPSDMIDPVYGDLDRMAVPLAIRQLQAHLERLGRAGRIDL